MEQFITRSNWRYVQISLFAETLASQQPEPCNLFNVSDARFIDVLSEYGIRWQAAKRDSVRLGLYGLLQDLQEIIFGVFKASNLLDCMG